MNIKERIDSFVHLGKVLRSGDYPDVLKLAIDKAVYQNPWFTKESVVFAAASLGKMLDPGKIERWIDAYRERLDIESEPKTVGVIMAGNIPMVGFHDFLCVLISGNRFLGKLSSGDRYLLPALSELLISENSGWKSMIRFTEERISGFQAIIATGSNNSSRYFDYYFAHYPNIIRRNRNSVAILNGDEDDELLSALAGDIFSYFGLGCRNVSKLYLPTGYDIRRLQDPFAGYSGYSLHNKYQNNYEYHKAVYLVNRIPFYDGGFFLMTEQSGFASPVSVIHYEFYSDINTLLRELDSRADQIQCIVSANAITASSVLPGASQHPEPWDYADNVDTLEFLLKKN